jgi:hypothetical protein
LFPDSGATAALEEHSGERPMADPVAERAEREQRHQDQQQDDDGPDPLVQRAAAELGERLPDRTAMNNTADRFLDDHQNDQQHQHGE